MSIYTPPLRPPPHPAPCPCSCATCARTYAGLDARPPLPLRSSDGRTAHVPNLLTLLPHLVQVMVAQANFVRVRVKAVEGAAAGSTPPQRELLCVARTHQPFRLYVPPHMQRMPLKNSYLCVCA